MMTFKEEYQYFKKVLNDIYTSVDNTPDNYWRKLCIDKFLNKYDIERLLQYQQDLQWYKQQLDEVETQLDYANANLQQWKYTLEQIKSLFIKFLQSQIGVQQLIEKYKVLLGINKYNNFVNSIKSISNLGE